MDCPKCKAGMDKVLYHGIEVDRCKDCHGIWFDLNEEKHLKEQLQDSVDIQRIDSGNPALAKNYNEMENVKCPVCNIVMISMVDDSHGQPIKYESCKICYGAFFDAGEFKEYAQEDALTKLFRKLKAKFQ